LKKGGEVDITYSFIIFCPIEGGKGKRGKKEGRGSQVTRLYSDYLLVSSVPQYFWGRKRKKKKRINAAFSSHLSMCIAIFIRQEKKRGKRGGKGERRGGDDRFSTRFASLISILFDEKRKEKEKGRGKGKRGGRRGTGPSTVRFRPARRRGKGKKKGKGRGKETKSGGDVPTISIPLLHS